jgi:4-diphosphocytidyl-2-C-methyl-D-erythritol kinase
MKSTNELNQSSPRMIQFPNCKINLGLSIIAKRADGYHELETVFYPIALSDALEILPADSLTLTQSGISVPGDPEQNLCLKAYHLLKKDFPELPPVQIHLHKNIPMGAGLGGGSSDGSFALMLLNKQFSLGLNDIQLIDYASQLGSDCPFFVYNKACHAKGRGEILTPIELDLSNYQFVLVHPGKHISTAWAFQQLSPNTKSESIQSIIEKPIGEWKDYLMNDFESPVFKAEPTLSNIKDQLYHLGAIYASMSGSGSSLFGIFPKNHFEHAPTISHALRIDLI